MFNWNDIMMQRERYKGFLHEAERERLVGQARAGSTTRTRFPLRVAAWLRRWQVAREPQQSVSPSLVSEDRV